MMGMSVGESGTILVTDMDRIEQSNLNRQFLFRNENVGKPKSTTAAAAAMSMNPDLHIDSTEVPVGPDTETTFHDAFWENLTLVTNALDNLKARLYVDGRCVFYRKPLMESGTLGTKANTQVIIPFQTESYGDSVDPPEESIPMCTLRNFPHLIEHCIEWSRDQFEASFVSAQKDAEAFQHDPAAWLASASKESNVTTKRAQLQGVVNAIQNAQLKSPEMCVRVARLAFNEHFNLNIRQLLHNFPVDYVDSNGIKFWSGPKRAPEALEFDPADTTHLSYVTAAARILAKGYDVVLPDDFDSIEVVGPLLDEVAPSIPAFVPRVVRIKTREDEAVPEGGGDDDDEAVRRLTAELQSYIPELGALAFNPAEFEKDDDSNGHIDFVTAASNLRARNYKIKEATRHQVKMIAGKIVPAIATTTCMITGLVCVEMYKVLKGADCNGTLNSYVNLAVNVYSMANPQPPKKNCSKDFDPVSRGPVKAVPEGFSSWDRNIVHGNFTCAALAQHMETKFSLSTQMISAGPKLLYAPMLYASHKKRADRPIRDVYEEVIGPIGPGRKYVVLDMTMDDDGTDVIMPQLQLFFE